MNIRAYNLDIGDEFSVSTSLIINGKKIKAGHYVEIDQNTGKLFFKKDQGFLIVTSRDKIKYKFLEVMKILFMFIFRIPKYDSVRIKKLKVPFEKCNHKNTEFTQHGPIEVCLDCGGWFDEAAQKWRNY